MGCLDGRDPVWDKTGMDKIFCMVMNISAGRSAIPTECKSVFLMCIYFNVEKVQTLHDNRCNHSATRELCDCFSPYNICGICHI